jgi:hypothetical protein
VKALTVYRDSPLPIEAAYRLPRAVVSKKKSFERVETDRRTDEGRRQAGQAVTALNVYRDSEQPLQ